MQITAAIVIYQNDPKLLQDSLTSFLNCTLDIRLFLIDNSPTDHLRYLATDPRVYYIFNGENLGFGKAHNIGIQKSLELKSKYHLVLNPDIFFGNGLIENIYSFMESNMNFGLLMPKVTYPDGSIQYLCKNPPSISILILRRFMPKFIQRLFRNKLDTYDYKDHDYNEIIINVPYLSGCFMFFRNSILEKLTGFDEKIFMYMEDADITIRTLEFSETIYYPHVTIHHHFAKGSYKSIKLMYYNIHGAFVYFKKWGWRL